MIKTNATGKKGFWASVGGFFAKVGQKIGAYFKCINPLVMMQLKNKVDFSFLKSKKKTLFKVIYSLLQFILLTAIIYFVFNIVVALGLFSFLRTLNFRVFLVVMTVILIITFISCLVNVTQTLYFSKDNPVLLTMPVTVNQLFNSKLAVILIYEFIKNITYLWPFLLAYGVVMHLGIGYFVWSFIAVLIVTILLVAICALLSIPAMALTIMFKRHRILDIVLSVAALGVIVYGVIYGISLIPADIDLVRDWGRIYWQIQDFLLNFSTIFVPFTYLMQLLTGMAYNTFTFNLFTEANGFTFLAILAIVVVCLALTYLLVKKIFLSMASNPFEYRKKTIKRFRKNSKHTAFVSSVNQENRRVWRTPNILYGTILIAIITPIAVFFENQIIAAMDTRALGQYMLIAFNILIMLLLTLSSNISLASLYSREGNSAYLNKINPTKYFVPLSGKLVFYAVLMMLSLVASCVVTAIYAGFGVGATIMLTLGVLFVYLAHLFWSVELDVMNPQNEQYQTSGEHQRNPNELKSTIIAFVSAFLFAFFTYFLLNENIQVVFIKLLFIGFIYFVIRTYLLFTRISLYYKEK